MVSGDEGIGLEAIDTVLARMRGFGDAPALWWQGEYHSYAMLLHATETWRRRLRADGIGAGDVCAFLADFAPSSAALLLALMLERAIAVPFTPSASIEMGTCLALAGATTLYRCTDDAEAVLTRLPGAAPDLIVRFREQRSPGLVVFTSGSTGAPKGILHDVERVMRKFVAPRAAWRAVLFLMMDHFGGYNTLLATLSSGGLGVCVPDRSPDAVCSVIAETAATLLPTSPTFLNLLLAGGAHRAFDLSSVRLITYGTEVMAEGTLTRVRSAFPNAHLKQTYGLSELGVLRSTSQSDDSVWVRLGGDGFDVRVVDGVLWVRSEANMVGYINAPSPFDDSGWLCTGDRVEVSGDYVRILGRDTELINVGGQKVFPAEIESVLLGDADVLDAAAFGVAHPLMGQVVHVRVATAIPEPDALLVARLRRRCVQQLARYKVPVKFLFVSEAELRSTRFKKIRRSDTGPA